MKIYEVGDLIEKFDNGEATDEEVDRAIKDIFNEIKDGEIIGGYEIQFLNEIFTPCDEELAGVERHGWVVYNQIWNIEGKFYKCKRYYHDDHGSDYDDQVFIPCVKRVIETEVWEEANED